VVAHVDGNGRDASPDEDFDASYLRTFRQAYQFAYLLTGDAGVSEDLAQEAYLRVASKLSQMEGAAAHAYLRQTVYRGLLMNIRAASRRRRREAYWISGRTSQSDLASVDASIDLVALVRRLPVKQRTTVVLRYWCDLPERDIALLMKCSIGTVKSNLSRALTKIREGVGNDG